MREKISRGQHRDDEEGDPHRVVVREQGQQHQAGHHDRDDQRPVHHLVLQSAAVAPVLGEGVGGLGLEEGCGFRHLVPSFLMGWSKAQADRSRSGYPFCPLRGAAVDVGVQPADDKAIFAGRTGGGEVVVLTDGVDSRYPGEGQSPWLVLSAAYRCAGRASRG